MSLNSVGALFTVIASAEGQIANQTLKAGVGCDHTQCSDDIRPNSKKKMKRIQETGRVMLSLTMAHGLQDPTIDHGDRHRRRTIPQPQTATSILSEEFALNLQVLF
jgi:hypothetical protein